MNNWVLNPAYYNVERKAIELINNGVNPKTESRHGDYVIVNTIFERCRAYLTDGDNGKRAVRDIRSRSQISKLFEIVTCSGLN